MADVAERKGVPVAVAASVSRNADLEEQLRQATAEINRLMSELEIAQAKDGLEALPNAVDDWVPSSSAEADGEPEHVGAVAERSSEEVEIASEAEDLVRATVAAAEGVPSDAELEAKTLQDADDIERLRAEFLAALAQIEDESAPQAVDGEGSPSPAESERESAPAGSVEIVPEADDRSGAPFVAAGLVSRNADLEVQVREDAAEFERLESQLAAAQAEAAGLREERDASDIVRTGAAVAIGGALLSEEPEATTEASDEVHVPDQPDDFTVFEGIGPTRAARLHNAGILTYADLAACDEDHLREVLALQPWQRSDPALWIAEAKWLVVHPRKPLIGDNLRRIEGIGPTYLARLRAAGLITFADIANASPDYLSELISAPAWRKLTIEEWIAQAQLLVAGDEEGLRALQQDLNRRDTNKLILIEGLGPKGIAAMNAVGITGVTELAEAKPEQLAQAFSAAGLRPGHFEAWIAEAKLRAAGKRVVHTHGAHLGEGE
jgi:predicted flap endonuclease-1-like 5' DNA nuclease